MCSPSAASVAHCAARARSIAQAGRCAHCKKVVRELAQPEPLDILSKEMGKKTGVAIINMAAASSAAAAACSSAQRNRAQDITSYIARAASSGAGAR